MSDRNRYLARPLMDPGTLRAQDGMPPAEVRAVIEGTWELTEWHVGDVVVRPPEIAGWWTTAT